MREAELRSEKIIEEGRAEEAGSGARSRRSGRVRRQLIEDFRATLRATNRRCRPEFGHPFRKRTRGCRDRAHPRKDRPRDDDPDVGDDEQLTRFASATKK